VVMGVALLLTGIGLLVLTLGPLRALVGEGRRRKDAKQPAPVPATEL
jgi:hypothetical protein